MGIHLIGKIFMQVFLIYMNHLAENLSSNPKLFANDTSLFSVARELNTSLNEINDDLKKFDTQAHQCKTSFNSDPLKQAQEVIFSRKKNKPRYSNIVFNGSPVKESSQKKIWECFLIVNLILMKILKDNLIKLVNLLVLLANSEIFYRDHLFYKSISLLLDLTQIPGTLSLIRLLQGLSNRNLNSSNIMQL